LEGQALSNQSRSAILVYHSLDTSGLVFSTDPGVFRAQIEAIAGSGLRTVPLEMIRRVPGAVALTFDDGYANFLDHALPLLVDHRLPATLFVVSGYCGRRRGWLSQSPPGTGQPLLSWNAIRQIAEAGITIGAHTVNHPDLLSLSDEQAIREMRDCRHEIEDRIGRPANALAYPYGRSNERIRRLAREEFQLACGTRLALVNDSSDPHDMPRIFDFYVKSPFWLRKLNRADGRAYIAARGWVAKGRDLLKSRSLACI